MRMTHVVAAAAAVLAAVLALPSPGHADQLITHTFAADSGDSCRYGFTDGTLTWRFGPSPTPLPVVAVEVKGRVADRPLLADPGFPCRDDSLFSVATFTAFSGLREIDRQGARADNGVTSFQFTLGVNSTTARIDRVVVQVCRHKPSSVLPSYCGRPVEYRTPPVITP